MVVVTVPKASPASIAQRVQHFEPMGVVAERLIRDQNVGLQLGQVARLFRVDGATVLAMASALLAILLRRGRRRVRPRLKPRFAAARGGGVGRQTASPNIPSRPTNRLPKDYDHRRDSDLTKSLPVSTFWRDPSPAFDCNERVETASQEGASVSSSVEAVSVCRAIGPVVLTTATGPRAGLSWRPLMRTCKDHRLQTQ